MLINFNEYTTKLPTTNLTGCISGIDLHTESLCLFTKPLDNMSKTDYIISHVVKWKTCH